MGFLFRFFLCSALFGIFAHVSRHIYTPTFFFSLLTFSRWHCVLSIHYSHIALQSFTAYHFVIQAITMSTRQQLAIHCLCFTYTQTHTHNVQLHFAFIRFGFESLIVKIPSILRFIIEAPYSSRHNARVDHRPFACTTPLARKSSNLILWFNTDEPETDNNTEWNTTNSLHMIWLRTILAFFFSSFFFFRNLFYKNRNKIFKRKNKMPYINDVSHVHRHCMP